MQANEHAVQSFRICQAVPQGASAGEPIRQCPGLTKDGGGGAESDRAKAGVLKKRRSTDKKATAD
jgi:hypothetical protein